jgi:predicted dienelactone hydrolase
LADINKLPLDPQRIPEGVQYPVVLFSHGLAGNAETYTKRCMDLASHGYVVIAFEHEDGSGAFARTADRSLVPYQVCYLKCVDVR